MGGGGLSPEPQTDKWLPQSPFISDDDILLWCLYSQLVHGYDIPCNVQTMMMNDRHQV